MKKWSDIVILKDDDYMSKSSKEVFNNFKVASSRRLILEELREMMFKIELKEMKQNLSQVMDALQGGSALNGENLKIYQKAKEESKLYKKEILKFKDKKVADIALQIYEQTKDNHYFETDLNKAMRYYKEKMKFRKE